MSSLQIAETTGKPHNDVMKAIRKMEPAWSKVNGGNFSLVKYKDAKGQIRPCYQLTKLECLYIATKFNDEARAKLVLRWNELEKSNTQPKAPTTLKEALLLALAQQEQIEQQQERIECQRAEISALNYKVEQLQPKAEYYDSILRSPDSVVVTQIANDYGMSPQKFNKRLNALGIQYKVNGQWVLYAKYQGEGYTDSFTGIKRNSNGSWMLTTWTQKGRLFLYTMLKEANILPVIERPRGYQLPPVSKTVNGNPYLPQFYR